MKSVLSDAIENDFVDAVIRLNLHKIKLVVTGRGLSHGVRSAITKHMIRAFDTARSCVISRFSGEIISRDWRSSQGDARCRRQAGAGTKSAAADTAYTRHRNPAGSRTRTSILARPGGSANPYPRVRAAPGRTSQARRPLASRFSDTMGKISHPRASEYHAPFQLLPSKDKCYDEPP